MTISLAFYLYCFSFLLSLHYLFIRLSLSFFAQFVVHKSCLFMFILIPLMTNFKFFSETLFCFRNHFLTLIKSMVYSRNLHLKFSRLDIYPLIKTTVPTHPLFHSFVPWCQKKAQAAAAMIDKGLKSRFSHVRELILEEQSQAKKKQKKKDRYDLFSLICEINQAVCNLL